MSKGSVTVFLCYVVLNSLFRLILFKCLNRTHAALWLNAKSSFESSLGVL